MGIRGKMNNIIKSYMSNRKAATKIDKTVSDLENINYGIPQGSVMGPLLFLIYINEVEQVVKNNIYMFADDLMLISINDEYSKMMELLQEDFNSICEWCMDNEVFISETKTQCMCIKSPCRKITQIRNIYFHLPSCNLENCVDKCPKLPDTKEAKYLGFIIDSKWTYIKHIENIIIRLRKLMPSLYKIKYHLPINAKKILYFAWIESILRYGIELYGQATETQLDKIQKVQNKIIKILFKNTDEITAKEMYIKHNILNVRQLRDFIISCNNYFNPKYKQVSVMKSDLLRKTSYRYNVPFAQNEYGKRTRNFVVPTLFNKLPFEMLHLQGIKKMKKELKVHIMGENPGKHQK
jgi:hypothetical protein